MLNAFPTKLNTIYYFSGSLVSNLQEKSFFKTILNIEKITPVYLYGTFIYLSSLNIKIHFLNYCYFLFTRFCLYIIWFTFPLGALLWICLNTKKASLLGFFLMYNTIHAFHISYLASFATFFRYIQSRLSDILDTWNYR